MSTLVIGGTGFIGKYLCRELVARGEKIIAVGRPEQNQEEQVEGVRYESIDLDTNFLDLRKIMDGVDKIVFALQPNILRTKKILSAASNFDGIRKVIFLSTTLVYPDSLDRQDETKTPDPQTEYEKDKIEEEKLFTEAAENNKWQLSITRLGNVYGDVKNRGVVNGVITVLLHGSSINIDGNGKNLRDFIFVMDVAQILSDIIISNLPQFSGIFNVCTGIGSSVINVIENLEKISNRKVIKFFVKSVSPLKNIIGDNHKIMSIVKRVPLSLAEGLAKTYDNYLKYNQINKI